MKKAIIISSFIIYWLLMILNTILENSGIFVLLFYVMLFMPLTIAIIKEKDSFALAIIILYEIAELLMSLMFVASSFVEIEEASVILIITEFITAFYAFSLMSSSFKLIRNKENNLMLYIIAFGILRCSFTFVNFIIAKDYSADMIISMISNVVFILAISTYIVSFGKKEIKIFNKNE